MGLSRRELAERVAEDLEEGWYVNLGIGMPTLVAEFMSPNKEVVLHTENGLLGMGPRPARGEEDPDHLINAGKEPVTAVLGAAYFDHAMSFAMIRGGHIDVCVLGAYQVSSAGDLANWSTGHERAAPAVGGAMDLACSAKRVFVMMDHVGRDGVPKIVRRCSLPLTAPRAVQRIYTNLAVIDVERGALVVRETFGVSFTELQSKTEAPLVRA